MRIVEKKIEKKFWVVWCPNRGKSQTIHKSMFDAYAEAERLAELENETFYVLETVAAVGYQVSEVTTRTTFTD